MRVKADIEVVEMESEHGKVYGVQAQCSRCDHAVESFGTGRDSIRRCLALLREECPNHEKNFYEKA